MQSEKSAYASKQNMLELRTLKFIFSKKATKIDKIFTVDLMHTTYRQINGEDFINFCGLPREHER